MKLIFLKTKIKKYKIHPKKKIGGEATWAWGSNPCHSSDNAGFLTCRAARELLNFFVSRVNRCKIMKSNFYSSLSLFSLSFCMYHIMDGKRVVNQLRFTAQTLSSMDIAFATHIWSLICGAANVIIAKIWPLPAGAKLKMQRQSFGKRRKHSFIARQRWRGAQ